MTKAERIRQARKDAKLTLEELAYKCGTTKQTIFKYEQGIITNIPLDKIEAIAKALYVSPGYIMGWETSEEIDAFDNGTILGKAAKDPRQIHLLKTFQSLNDDNKDKAIQFLDALALLPQSEATP